MMLIIDNTIMIVFLIIFLVLITGAVVYGVVFMYRKKLRMRKLSQGMKSCKTLITCKR